MPPSQCDSTSSSTWRYSCLLAGVVVQQGVAAHAERSADALERGTLEAEARELRLGLAQDGAFLVEAAVAAGGERWGGSRREAGKSGWAVFYHLVSILARFSLLATAVPPDSARR